MFASMARSTAVCVCVGFAAGASCGGTGARAVDAAGNPAAEARAIARVYETFSRGYATLDADLVANLYTENALYLSPGNDIRRGRAAIRAGFRRSFDRARERGEAMAIEFDRLDRRVSGDLAYEVGYYSVTYASASTGKSRTSRGKFAVVLIRQRNGAWLFHVDSYSDVK